MPQENNDVLISISLMERAIALMKEDTREPVRKSSLTQVERMLNNVLIKIVPFTKESLILVPCMEVLELIKVMLEDASFEETDNESKTLIVKKLKDSLNFMYLFAGKHYMTNEFSYSMGLSDILKRVVDNCIANNFYFGYDNILRAEGAID